MAGRAEGPKPEDRVSAEPSFAEAVAAAAQRSGLGRVAPGQTPTAGALLAAIGGIRGLVESILPGVLFLTVYTITHEVVPSVLAPIALALVFIVVRVVARQPVISAVVGALGIAVSAGIALASGRAEDNFVLGFLISGGTIVVMLVSLAMRRPLIGVLVGLLTGDAAWRGDPAKFRVALVATILWAALPALRLSVQLPMYLAERPDLLAATKLVMGVPLYAILLWVTWLLIRSAWGEPREPGDIAKA